MAEIQIRTLAMNFWAVNEHTLNYKYKGNIPPEIRERLKNCAEAAFNLDNEMSTIRNEIIYAQKVNMRMDSVISDIIDNIQNMYFKLRLSDVEKINKQFVELWNKGDIEELEKFSAKLKEMTEPYRR